MFTNAIVTFGAARIPKLLKKEKGHSKTTYNLHLI